MKKPMKKKELHKKDKLDLYAREVEGFGTFDLGSRNFVAWRIEKLEEMRAIVELKKAAYMTLFFQKCRCLEGFE
jgi:hypothetical protein